VLSIDRDNRADGHNWRLLPLICVLIMQLLCLPARAAGTAGSNADAASQATNATADDSDDDSDTAADDNSGASLYIAANDDGRMTVMLNTAVPSQSDTAALRAALESSLGTRITQSSTSSFIPFIGRAFHRPVISNFDGTVLINGELVGAPVRSGLMLTESINLGPLANELTKAGAKSLFVTVQLPDVPRISCKGLKSARSMEIPGYYNSEFKLSSTTPPPVVIDYGYDSPYLVKRFTPMIATAAVATLIFALLWISTVIRIGNAQKQSERAFQRFTYSRSTQWLTVIMWLIWSPLVIINRTDRVVEFLTGGSVLADIHPDLALVFAPALFALIIALASFPIHRAATRNLLPAAEYFATAVLGALNTLPLFCGLVGFEYLLSDANSAIAWFAGAVLIRQATKLGAVVSRSATPISVVTGELWSHTDALARKAGVKISNLFVMPMANWRVANAFASANNAVIITDLLLESLPKPEVDAIVAHEITHLKNGDAKRGLNRLLLSVVAAIAANFAVNDEWPGHEYGAYVYTATMIAGIWLSNAKSRSNEYRADAGSAHLTNQPQALISGLSRLQVIAGYPVQWNRFVEFWSTHPSTTRRARALSRLAGYDIPVAPIALEPHAESEAEDPSAVDATFYTMPTHRSRVQSATERQRETSVAAFTIMIATAALSVVAARVAASVKFLDTEFGALCALAAGIAILNLIRRTFFDAWDAIRSRKTEAMLNAQLSRESGNSPGARAPIFVASCVGKNSRLIGGSFDAEYGYIDLDGNALRYDGEQDRLVLPRSSIESIFLRRVLPMGWNPKRVCVSVRHPVGSSSASDGRTEEAPAQKVTSMSFRTVDTKVRLFLRDDAAKLLAELQAWKDRSPSESTAEPEPEFVWKVAKVVGANPSKAIKLNTASGFLIQWFALAAGVAVVSGMPLSFDLTPASAIFPGLVSAGVIGFDLLNFKFYRDTPDRLANPAPLMKVGPFEETPEPNSAVK
jgi:Zn-dependent protease with chaperone function